MSACDTSDMKEIQIKRGDTLVWTCLYNYDGVPLPLPDKIFSQIKSVKGKVLADLEVIRNQDDEDFEGESGDDNPMQGVFTLYADDDTTSGWRPGVYRCDIEYHTGDIVHSTETFLVRVVRDVTYE